MLLPDDVDHLGNGLRAGLPFMGTGGKGGHIGKSIPLSKIVEGKASGKDNLFAGCLAYDGGKFLIQLLELFLISFLPLAVDSFPLRILLAQGVSDIGAKTGLVQM